MGVENTLKRVLIREGVLQNTSGHWRVQVGGRTNKVWKIETPGGALVCKLFATTNANPLYPNHPGAEYEALKALHQHAIAPEPVALLNTDIGEVLVYRHIDGTSWRQDSAPVARLLARLHALNLDIPLRRLSSGSSALIRQTLNILDECCRVPKDMPRLVSDPSTPPLKTAVPVHTDVVANNLVVSGNDPWLIDWQCPAMGDPCEDLSSFLSPAMQHLYGTGPLSDGEISEFLGAYPNPGVVRRYRALAALYHWRIAAYCLWKVERGDADYKDAFTLELSALKQAQQKQKST